MAGATLKKEERLSSFRLIEKVFCRDCSRSFSVYPLRVSYIPSNDGTQILVTVPKHCFKHAVDRNRIKRHIREAYRRNKGLLDKSVIMAFVWLSGDMLSSAETEYRVRMILKRINNADN